MLRLLKAGWILGSIVVAATAAFAILVGRVMHATVVIPVAFLLIIIFCARYFGLIAGIVGSVIATVLFATFLFEPYGSLHVNDRHGLSNLAILLFAGVVLSYAHSGQQEGHPPTRRLK